MSQYAKENLKQKQQYLDMLVDYSPFPMWVGNPNGTILHGNKALYKSLNLSPEQVVGKYNLLHDDNLQSPEIAAKLQRLFNRKEQIQFKLNWQANAVSAVDFTNGKNLTIDVTIFPLLDQSGEITHIICQWLDLTEYLQAERELAASEERFRTICEKAPIFINGFSDDGRCILWNQQCRETFGWTREEINAQANPMALFYPEVSTYSAALNSVTKDPDGHFREWHPRTKDGKTLITSWASFRVPNGQVFSIGHDITERKKAEKELQESEALLRQSQEIARLGNWTLDISSGQITWSDALYRIFKISPGECELNHEYLLSQIHPEDRAKYENLTAQLMTEGSAYFEYRLVLTNGAIRWVSGQGVAHLNEAGEAVKLSGILQDVTERKQAEDALRKSHDLLEKRVQERTKDLQIMVDAMAGRENRMADLKLEIKKLRAQLMAAGIEPAPVELTYFQETGDES